MTWRRGAYVLRVVESWLHIGKMRYEVWGTECSRGYCWPSVWDSGDASDEIYAWDQFWEMSR